MKPFPIVSIVRGVGLALVVAGLAQPALAQQCRFTDERSASLDPAGIDMTRIVARAGTLEIRGQQGLNEVRIEGTACAPSQAELDRVTLRAERRSGEVYVETLVPDGDWFEASPTLDLVVTVPARMNLDVSDRSGPVEVFGVQSLRLEDYSGSIEVADIAGAVYIDDGSGSISVTRAGSVEIEDGSGSVRVMQIEGAVRIRDGSGSVHAEDVGGDVQVWDGSSSIDVSGVAGNFTVERDGSGSVHYENVEGRVSLPSRR